MSYWRLHYHLVWATYERTPLLERAVERQVHGAILDKANEMGILVHAIGNVEDHIHVAASIPPRIAVADCLKHFKGASSRFVNSQPGAAGNFGWQDGYGALTFSDRGMSGVVSYVRNQKEHHRQKTTRDLFERIAEEDEGVGKSGQFSSSQGT
jgi:putative transposase